MGSARRRGFDTARAGGDMRRYHLAQRLDALTSRIISMRGGGAQVAALRAEAVKVHKQWADIYDLKEGA